MLRETERTKGPVSESKMGRVFILVVTRYIGCWWCLATERLGGGVLICSAWICAVAVQTAWRVAIVDMAC